MCTCRMFYDLANFLFCYRRNQSNTFFTGGESIATVMKAFILELNICWPQDEGHSHKITSTSQFIWKLLQQLEFELPESELQKERGVTDLVSETHVRQLVEKYPDFQEVSSQISL